MAQLCQLQFLNSSTKDILKKKKKSLPNTALPGAQAFKLLEIISQIESLQEIWRDFLVSTRQR